MDELDFAHFRFPERIAITCDIKDPWTGTPFSLGFGNTNPLCGGAGSPTLRCSVRARGDNRPDSDIDILVEIGPMSLWGYVGLTQFIEGLFPDPVEVADRSRLKPFVRPAAERDAIYAF